MNSVKYILLFSMLVLVYKEPVAQPLNPGFDKILFVKRFTYSANHYYTQHLNSDWMPGGNLFVLDLKTKEVNALVPELEGGVFGRFDLDYDARHVVFAWKKSQWVGYRIYEIEIDPGTGARVGPLTQITFPPKNEPGLMAKYGTRKADGGKWDYHHGTEDLDPCYLPDGNIVFVSSRCQYGTLCDAPDVFVTTTMYRMDRDGSDIRQLSFGSLNEFTPVILPDGRIIYSRWEYVDKGAVAVKCLWAMRPDGSASQEIYGNDIAAPTTMIQARPLPQRKGEYVMLGTPHCPQGQVGTVIRLDMSKDIRSRDPMSYITDDIDIMIEPGFHFQSGDTMIFDRAGKTGRLFTDPYPVNQGFYLAARKDPGVPWKDPRAYGLVWLNENGEDIPLYQDPEISCFHPFPLKVRTRPPVLPSTTDPELAKRNLANCVVTDVYHGLEDVERGCIKYIRILEQVPRPWAARRLWEGDAYDQQHACVSKDTHLGLKVQHGIVPVEQDGSAHFVVPANKNIFFQVLDEHYMAVQTERTFVNYMPGESRSCIGCHETPGSSPSNRRNTFPMALSRAPSDPGPQPGELSGQRPIDYAADVQPIWDRHCIQCHSGAVPEGGLDLSGTMTEHFSVSYESLIEARRDREGGVLWRLDESEIPDDIYGRKPGQLLLAGPTIGENHPKDDNVHYMPARSFGSHTSILVAMLAPGKVHLSDPAHSSRARELSEVHKEVQLSQDEMVKVITWVDTNAQFYGMYWGRRNIRYKDHPNFRPRPTFERATAMTSLIPEEER